VPILTVVVPVLTTDNLTWQCSSEAPARQCLSSRGLVPILAEGSARASDSDTTDEILHAALEHAKDMKLCRPGDCVVALHRIGNASGAHCSTQRGPGCTACWAVGGPAGEVVWRAVQHCRVYWASAQGLICMCLRVCGLVKPAALGLVLGSVLGPQR
jgi:hypothetical protein